MVECLFFILRLNCHVHILKFKDSVLVVFTKCENTGIESFFCLPENQLIVNLSAICEPFLTASVTDRKTTPPRATTAAVSDLCGV